MTTFNIDMIGSLIYDPELLGGRTKYHPHYKLKNAYADLKFRADATWELFVETVSSYGRKTGLTETDFSSLRALANKLKKIFGVTVDYMSCRDLVCPANKRSAVPFDTYTLADLRSQTKGIADSVAAHVLLVATAGVSIEQWQETKKVLPDMLVLNNGTQIPLQSDEAAVLLECWHSRDAYNEFYGMLETNKVADGDKNHKLHVHLNKYRDAYTYEQILFVWELNRYLTNGMSDAESVAERTGISLDTCQEHPSTWKANRLISDATYASLM